MPKKPAAQKGKKGAAATPLAVEDCDLHGKSAYRQRAEDEKTIQATEGRKLAAELCRFNQLTCLTGQCGAKTKAMAEKSELEAGCGIPLCFHSGWTLFGCSLWRFQLTLHRVAL